MNTHFAAHILDLLGGEEALVGALGPAARFTALVGASPGVRIERACGMAAVAADIVLCGRGTYAVRVAYGQAGHVSQEVAEESLSLAIPVLTGWRLPSCGRTTSRPDSSIAAMAF